MSQENVEMSLLVVDAWNRQGKIVSARLFSEPADALEAAGLRE